MAIKRFTGKLSRLTQAESTAVYADIQMIDINKSK